MQMIVSEGSPICRRLQEIVAPERRCLFMVGVPGVGKSLWAQQAALLATSQGRGVTLLQWDVVRRPLEAPPYDMLFPEVDGVTHPAIRSAVNAWVRGAIKRWDEEAAPNDLLIGEGSLMQHRLTDLASPIDDDAEALLGGERTLFVAPTPAVGVREHIARARAEDSAAPRHEDDKGSAAPNVLEESWRALQFFEDPSLDRNAPFDPERYIAIYSKLLRFRRFERLDIDEQCDVKSSAFDLPPSVKRLEIDPQEVEEIIAPYKGVAADVLERAIPILPEWY
jgi:hypothetical protein